MAAILNSAILDSSILHQKKLPLFILNQPDDGSHVEFYHLGFSHFTQKISFIHSDSTWWWQPSSIGHLGFSHLSFSSQTHSHFPRLLPTISKKKNFPQSSLFTICTKYFTHSIWLTWWWQPSWILPSWIHPFLNKKKLHSFILTQLDDGSYLELCHVGFRHCHLGLRHLCYLFTDSFKNTLPPIWFCLKLIQSDSNSFILTQIDDGSQPEFCHLEFCLVGISHFAQNSDSN